MRIPRLLSALLAFAAAPLAASPAFGATVESISYTVTGGTFSGSRLNGPISGGSLTITPQVPISTPGSTTFFAWRLTLTAGGGSPAITGVVASAPGPIAGFLQIDTGRVFGTNTASYFRTDGLFVPLNHISVASLVHTYSTLQQRGRFIGLFINYSSGCYCIQYNSFNHQFTLGSEVRTTVPAPPVGSLLGLGLLGLVAVGGVGARLTRRR